MDGPAVKPAQAWRRRLVSYNRAVPLLSALAPDEQATFLVVSLPKPALLKLAGSLGTAPPGVRVNTLSPWELADSLVDHYGDDAEVARVVDRSLTKTLGHAPLAAAVSTEGGAAAVTALLLEARDPARDLAWALLSAAPDAGALAAALVRTIIEEYDQADAAAAAEPPPGPDGPPAPVEVDKAAVDLEKEAARMRGQRERALKRADTLKERVVELERGLAEARRAGRAVEENQARVGTERDRLLEEREALRARLRAGTAAEVTRLTEELEAARRRERGLATDVEEARAATTALGTRLRTLEQAPSARPAPAGTDGEDAPSPGGGAGWHVPVFTAEFYDSIRRWDRRIVRSAFEKAHRLAEDWRHPSLRAIPLEGLPDYYRLRVATDVRLIYRLGDGGRVELLSLIDREDLPRYIRNVKGA